MIDVFDIASSFSLPHSIVPLPRFVICLVFASIFAITNFSTVFSAGDADAALIEDDDCGRESDAKPERELMLEPGRCDEESVGVLLDDRSAKIAGANFGPFFAV